jgi:hypothetical protein
MKQQTAREKAEKLYSQMTPARQRYEMMGVEPRGAMGATIDEIEQHIQNCMDAAESAGLHYLDESKIEFGLSREDIFAIAEKKATKSRSRRGYKVMLTKMQEKYGAEAGERIAKKIISR